MRPVVEEVEVQVQWRRLVEESNARRDSVAAAVVRAADDDSLRIVHRFAVSTF